MGRARGHSNATVAHVATRISKAVDDAQHARFRLTPERVDSFLADLQAADDPVLSIDEDLLAHAIGYAVAGDAGRALKRGTDLRTVYEPVGDYIAAWLLREVRRLRAGEREQPVVADTLRAIAEAALRVKRQAAASPARRGAHSFSPSVRRA